MPKEGLGLNTPWKEGQTASAGPLHDVPLEDLGLNTPWKEWQTASPGPGHDVPIVATPKIMKSTIVNNLYHHTCFYNQRCVLNVVVARCKIIFEKS